MDAILAKIPLVGIGPVLVISAVALFFLVMGFMAWRRSKVLSILLVLMFVVVGLGAAADWINTQKAYYDTAADLFGIPSYPVGDGAEIAGPAVQPQPNGLVVTIQVPDTQSKFGAFDAKVWLPPQYFTDARTHFPVVLLIAGNPGLNTDWLTSGGAASTGLAVAQSGKPVILVMPTVLRDRAFGDSLCLDTASQGNVETYLTKDVIAAVDDQLRTNVDPKQRGIGGLSMGGFCALNLGLKHPDLFSTVLDFSGDTEPVVDTLPGGLPDLFGPNYQPAVDANTPAKYLNTLNPARGPAIWMDVGASDAGSLGQISALVPKLKAKGFTVEFHTRPGDHDFTTFTNGLREALPWAAGRFYSTS